MSIKSILGWLIYKVFRRSKRIEVKMLKTEDENKDVVTADNMCLISPPPSQFPDLKSTFLEAFRSMNEERIKSEAEFMQDERLREYFKNAFDHLAKELPKSGATDVLFGYSNIGVSPYNWDAFCNIFIGVAKELSIEAKMPLGSGTHNYVVVDRKSLISAVDKMWQSNIDVDERIRAMLSSGGPYR